LLERGRWAFAGFVVVAVGVTGPIDIRAARARARGDRVLGRARGLAGVVHGFMDYDIMVDTGTLTPAACVSAILAALGKRKAP
jgi:chloramphenicol 3-O phosphotransferase